MTRAIKNRPRTLSRKGLRFIAADRYAQLKNDSAE